MTISVTAVESLEMVGPWWEIAWPVLPVRHTGGKCQPDTMENKKEGLGRAALTPLRAGGIELNGEGGQG